MIKKYHFQIVFFYSHTPYSWSNPGTNRKQERIPIMSLLTIAWKVNKCPCFCRIKIVCLIILGVCKIYEEHLKKLNPKSVSITYDITQLFEFVDHLADLSCLVYVYNISLFKLSISIFMNYKSCLGTKKVPWPMHLIIKTG